eukprot:s1681_g12.t1
MYELADFGDPWEYWSVHASQDRSKVSVVQNSRFGIGDVTFLMVIYGKLEYIQDTVKRTQPTQLPKGGYPEQQDITGPWTCMIAWQGRMQLTKHTVHLTGGRKLEGVTVILKSLGLLGDWAVDRLHKMTQMTGVWCDGDLASECRVFMKSDGRLASSRHNSNVACDVAARERTLWKPCKDCSWPSDEELRQVEEIRKICAAEIAAMPEQPRDVVGDIRVCRYLRFYGGKVNEAAKGLAEFLKWWVQEDIPSLRKGLIDLDPDDFHAWCDSARSPYSPVLVPGFAETEDGLMGHDGHTVIFVSPGYFKAQEFVSQRPACHTMENDLMLVRAGMEWMMKRVDDRSYEKKKMLYSIKVILVFQFKSLEFSSLHCKIDAQHLGREILPIRVYEVRKFAQDNAKQMMSMYCDHDILLLIVNAPWIIRFVVMFAHTFMTKRQSARLKVLGSASDADVQAQLRVVGPTSMFPPSLGGTKKPEDIPLYIPLAQDNPIAEWMARKEAGITRKGATNPPKPGTRPENAKESKEVVPISVTTPIANVEEEAATKVTAEAVSQANGISKGNEEDTQTNERNRSFWRRLRHPVEAGFAAQRHEPQSATLLVMSHEVWILAQSISMNAANFTTFSTGIGSHGWILGQKYLQDHPTEYYRMQGQGLLKQLPTNKADPHQVSFVVVRVRPLCLVLVAMFFAQHVGARKPSPLHDAESGRYLPTGGPACSISPLTIASMSTRVEIAAGLEGSLERAGSARLERLPSRRSNKTRQTAKSTTLVAAFLEQNGYLHVNGAKWSWGRKRYPLHTAVRQNQPATVRALLQLGASRTAVSGGLTAEEAARRYERRWGGYAEVLSVFQEPGVMAQECRCSAGSTSESDKVEGSTTCAFEGSTSESDSQPEDTTHRRLILL